MPLAIVAAGVIAIHVPQTVRIGETAPSTPVLSPVVVAAGTVAALTFAIMIGSFYLAEQYLQRTAGYSALGASAVLVLVALLVGAGAPVAGRLADRHGERPVAVLGFGLAGVGFAALAIPGMPLDTGLAVAPLMAVGVGLGMLFAPTSRAALNATPPSLHGRVSAVLSTGRLLGAAVGAGLAGVAIERGPSISTVHESLLIASVACLALGVPASTRLADPSVRFDSRVRAGD